MDFNWISALVGWLILILFFLVMGMLSTFKIAKRFGDWVWAAVLFLIFGFAAIVMIATACPGILR